MQSVRRHFIRIAAGAMLAMLAFALLPTVTRALTVSGTPSPWAEVCSARDEGGPKVPAPAGHGDHCPLCSHATGGPALPPTPGSGDWALRDGAAFVPTLFAQAAQTRFAYASARARAPPARA